jgi:spermidine synthase
MSNYQSDWQQQNLAAIYEQINWLHQQPDGIMFKQISGDNCIAIKKIKSLLLLLLVDRETLTTNVAQSIFDLNNPLNLIFPYARSMLLALIWQSQPKNIYVVGFGGGSLPRFFHHYFSQTTIECTELDSTVVEVAQKFFGIQLDDRLKVIIQEGREYLTQNQSILKYDLIIVDAGFGSGYMPYNLVTQEFYHLCQECLSSTGVLVVNIFHKQYFNMAVVKTLKSVFTEVYLCKVETGNTIVIATNAPYLTQNEIILKAEVIQDFHNLGFSLREPSLELQVVSQLPDWVNTWESLPIFTDAEIPMGYFDS